MWKNISKPVWHVSVLFSISLKAMLLIVDCKYQLIKENRVQAKPHIKGDAESREDGLTIKVKDREEVMTLLDEDEPEVEKGHKVHVL